MKKLLLNSIFALALVSLAGCYGTSANVDNGVKTTKGMKCGTGKCGKSMKSGAGCASKASKCGDAKKATKCGASAKCGDAKKETPMKCGAGKCGSAK